MSVEFVGIQLELIGEENVKSDLEQLDALLRSLGGRKKVKAGMGDLARETAKARGELEKYVRLREEYLEAGGKGEAYTKEIKEAERRLKDLQQAQREVTASTKNLGRTFRQQFQSIQSTIAHVGSAMQSFGNALTRLSSPFTRLTSGFLMGAGYKALNMITEGFGGAFERADTMKNYPRMLKEFGFSAEEATEAVGKLEQAVLGLPTGLDEIVAVQKRFVAASQDMDKATGLAIAFNNAVLASGADARQRLTAQRIITQLAGGAEIATSSWQALQRAIPLVFTELSEQAKMGVGDYVDALSKGKISTEEFMEEFIKIGGEGSIASAARVMTKSWEGLSANITNATKRMGTALLDTLHEVFKSETGRDLLDTLLGIDANGERTYDGIRDWIDGISKSAQEWIKANPDRIIDFFNSLKGVDWKGLLKGIADGMGMIFKAFEWLANKLEGKDLSKLGNAMMWSGIIGRGFTVLGGIIKGLRGPLAGIITVIARGGTKLFSGGGFFGKLTSLLGKKKDIEMAQSVGDAITTASPSLVSAFKNMALISGIVAMPAFTAWGVTSAVKNSIKNFKEIINLLKDMDWDAATKVAGGIAGFIGASAVLGGVVGKYGIGLGVDVMFGEVIVGLITSIATGFADLNMAFIKGSIEKFVESIKLLDQIPDVTSFGDVKTKIGNAISLMNEISALFQGRYVDKGVKEGGIQNIGFGVSWSISNFAKALAPLKDAVKSINELASMSIPPNAINRIGDIIDGIAELQSKMWVLMGFGFGNIKNNMTKVADAMYELRRVIYHINKLGGEKINDAGLKNVKDAITKIRDAFDAHAIAELKAKITEFVAAIQDALTQFDVFNKPIEIKASVKLASGFKTSVDRAVKEINSARGRINRAWNSIPTSFSKTITFTLRSRIVATSLYAGAAKARAIAESVRPAKGGLIYRARGGAVPKFKRVGTDTVPAMLTPGEYVHNKRAVSTFGIDFMRKVNNLDMKGAMNELMHRAGHMANINRGTSITNNNYNNQKVVINNSNAGAGYTFKTASRFVGAF